eukprot:2669975-Pleurochrysis_carterae.AAC.1
MRRRESVVRATRPRCLAVKITRRGPADDRSANGSLGRAAAARLPSPRDTRCCLYEWQRRRERAHAAEAASAMREAEAASPRSWASRRQG